MDEFGKVCLKPAVIWRDVGDGVLIEHGRRSFMMKGGKLFPVVSRLLSLVDEAPNLTALAESLPEQLRPVFGTLAKELSERAMLTSGEALPPELQDLDKGIVDLALDRCAAWPDALATWMARNIVVVGAEELRSGVVRQLQSLGAQNVQASAVDGPDLESADLIVGIADSAERANQLKRLASSGDAILATYRSGMAVVVAGRASELSHAPYLWQRLPSEDFEPSQSATASLHALIAYETFQHHLVSYQSDAEKKANGGDFRVMRRDGSVEHHSRDIMLASSKPFGLVSEQAAGELAEKAKLAPLFDRDAGLMTWRDEEGDSYPLLHRRIGLTEFAGEDGPADQITGWGLTPVEADRRTIQHALVRLAEVSQSHAGTAASPVVAAEDRDTAEALARAHMVAAQEGLWDRSNSSIVRPSPSEDRDLGTLIRLARLSMSGEMPVFRSCAIPERLGFVAFAQLGDEEAHALAADEISALYVALGTLLSARQLGLPIPPPPEPWQVSAGEQLQFVSPGTIDAQPFGLVVGQLIAGSAV